jgi:hypothetical protein
MSLKLFNLPVTPPPKSESIPEERRNQRSDQMLQAMIDRVNAVRSLEKENVDRAQSNPSSNPVPRNLIGLSELSKNTRYEIYAVLDELKRYPETPLPALAKSLAKTIVSIAATSPEAIHALVTKTLQNTPSKYQKEIITAILNELDPKNPLALRLNGAFAQTILTDKPTNREHVELLAALYKNMNANSPSFASNNALRFVIDYA